MEKSHGEKLLNFDDQTKQEARQTPATEDFKKIDQKTLSQKPVMETRKPLEKLPIIKTSEAEAVKIAEIKRSLQKPLVQNDAMSPEPTAVPMGSSNLEVGKVHKFYSWFAKYYDLSRKIWNPFFPASVEKEFNGLLSTYIKDGAEILDVGVGTGINIERVLNDNIAFAHYEGIDVNPEMLIEARHKFGDVNNMTLRLADVTQMEITQQYDVIISTLALSHLKEPDKAIQKLLTALKPGGKILYLDNFAVPKPRLRDKVAIWVYRKMFHFSPISTETAEKFPASEEKKHFPFLGGQLSMYVFQKNIDK
ncbi:MAG: class I SAM-dependent methyltransferase [Parcubacteria group bacterium]|nr:class I SAM-dependent methyltransferase [Parcubacteria group bacterium]